MRGKYVHYLKIELFARLICPTVLSKSGNNFVLPLQQLLKLISRNWFAKQIALA